MEESEKRKERLRAMRLEADQAILPSDGGNYPGASPGLTNPLNESPASQSMRDNPRFDYYTDPLAAFSKRGKLSHQVQQDYSTLPRPRNDSTPTPAYPANAFSLNQRMFQAPEIHHNSPTGSSVPTAPPFGMPRINSPGVFGGQNTYSPDHRLPQAPGVYHSSPLEARPFHTPHFNSSGLSSQYPPSDLSRGAHFPSSSFAQRGGSPGFNYGPGRGQRFNNSSTPGSGCGGSPYHSGRGRGGSPGFNYGPGRGQRFNNSSSPGSERGGGPYHSGGGRGGSGSHNVISAELRPDRYYIKSMVEDPWKLLNPVVWRRRDVSVQNTCPFSQDSWMPKSISMKKARPSEDSKRPVSEPSLAEYLATSFNEAEDSEAPNTNDGL